MHMQVDHVFEVQLLDVAWQSFLVEVFGGGNPQPKDAERTAIARTLNDIANLNVTTKKINGLYDGDG
jgi:ribosomal protein S9